MAAITRCAILQKKLEAITRYCYDTLMTVQKRIKIKFENCTILNYRPTMAENFPEWWRFFENNTTVITRTTLKLYQNTGHLIRH